MKMSIKPPQLKLFTWNREQNGTFEAHDPSIMYDPVSENFYSYSTDTAISSVYKKGIQIRRSKDLIEWQYIGNALADEAISEGSDNGAFPPTGGFWAPFVEYVSGEYRMYYSATKAFGSSESRIWLAVANHPEGPFYNRGVVMDTWFTEDSLPNAIDPHIIDDQGGCKYLIYGSFFGGIFIKELNPITGLSIGDVKELGKCISKRGIQLREDGPEGASIIYNPSTEYYYLFQSYGWLGDNYDIRVGRSKSVEGPYVDYVGKKLIEESMGMKLANSYRFTATNPHVALHKEEEWTWGGFRGPGHGVPFYDSKRNAYYFVHHIRDGAKQFRREEAGRVFYNIHYLMIRKMTFLEGWPLFSPEPYAGEEDGRISYDSIQGSWEVIELDDQSNELKTSKILSLEKNHIAIYENRQIGRWAYKEMNRELYIEWDDTLLKAKVMQCWDFENGYQSKCFTGYRGKGEVFWGKFIER